MSKLIIERFMDKVVKEPMSGCWIWVGAASPLGYGRFWFKKKTWGAHRASYWLFKGPFDEGLNVCHKCDIPSCVNPNHLFLGTQKDNVLDMVRKGRKVTPPQDGESNHHYGHRHSDETKAKIGESSRERIRKHGHPRAKIDENTVREIRRIRRETGASSRVISESLGLPKTTVDGVVYGYRWRHVK